MQDSNSPFFYILKFLSDPHNSENKIGLEIFYKVFLKEYNKYEIVKKYVDGTDLFHEFLEKIVFKGKGFQLNPTIKEKLDEKQTNIVSYIYMAIHNFLKTKHREIVRKYFIEEDEEKRPIHQPIYHKDDKGKEQESIPINENISPIVDIEAQEIAQIIKEEFSEKEKQTLCYMFFGDKSFFKEDISDDAAYKRKSRLKAKLSKFVREKGFSLEGFSYFVQEYLMSEICEKYR